MKRKNNLKYGKRQVLSKASQTKKIDIFSDDAPKVSSNIGSKFQAVIPKLHSEHKREDIVDKACLFWAPSDTISETILNEYLLTLKENYNFSYEQALGMLFWKNYDFKKALDAMNDFIPQKLDCWNLDDNIRFQSACAIVGKDFVRIEKMMPYKPIGSLIQYYYSNKKRKPKRVYKRSKNMSTKENNNTTENTLSSSEPCVKEDSILNPNGNTILNSDNQHLNVIQTESVLPFNESADCNNHQSIACKADTH